MCADMSIYMYAHCQHGHACRFLLFAIVFEITGASEEVPVKNV